MNTNNNPLMCDPVTGVCEVPQAAANTSKPVKLLYFTDPICSSCWGIEPQLRRLKLEYGDYLHIDYRMGGLLNSWDSYGGADVGSPTDVATHWDEASAYYDMPIDGDVWLEDPLHSSYPPSVAFKAAQLQDEEKAIAFLRRLREMLFMEKKNIIKWEYVAQAATESALDAAQLKADYEGKANHLFEADLAEARSLGVRGFPTIFFLDEEGNRLLVYGSKPYDRYESTLLKLLPTAEKKVYDTSMESLFAVYPTLAVKEYALLSGLEKNIAIQQLEQGVHDGKLGKITSKNGDLYRRK